MPSTRDIRRRIKSVKSTAQITKAMQLVASAKMKKAQDQATNRRPSSDMFNKILVGLREHIEKDAHPFFSEGKGSKTLILVITTDKGLCGGLNTNLLKKVILAADGETDFITIGRKGAQALSRLKRNLTADFPIADPAHFAQVRPVSKLIQDRFLSGDYKTVKVAFNNYVNTVTQVPVVETLLPVDHVKLGGKQSFDEPVKGEIADNAAAVTPQYSFEPGPTQVLEKAMPDYVSYTLYQMVLEARASEHSSRMVAMKNATDNAKGMIKDLTLEYNKVRQAAITNELLEITTAKMALG